MSYVKIAYSKLTNIETSTKIEDQLKVRLSNTSSLHIKNFRIEKRNTRALYSKKVKFRFTLPDKLDTVELSNINIDEEFIHYLIQQSFEPQDDMSIQNLLANGKVLGSLRKDERNRDLAPPKAYPVRYKVSILLQLYSLSKSNFDFYLLLLKHSLIEDLKFSLSYIPQLHLVEPTHGVGAEEILFDTTQFVKELLTIKTRVKKFAIDSVVEEDSEEYSLVNAFKLILKFFESVNGANHVSCTCRDLTVDDVLVFLIVAETIRLQLQGTFRMSISWYGLTTAA
eukprot:CAMPEP_0168318640 /NCGR_PEP_ID=MMETSP0213-20121227/594_1 /TAXON_ID=151035 /ORGANISM="Euplotes harpa, Strain FSP1.4" /LENGTH=281 /DNA_ID=CAMNT_0008319735 /DNA_START=1145 /DNA_END=1991 /DNA_ORIENTATION=-